MKRYNARMKYYEVMEKVCGSLTTTVYESVQMKLATKISVAQHGPARSFLERNAMRKRQLTLALRNHERTS
jgi:hypothetical protein